jgi:hypothetical protein
LTLVAPVIVTVGLTLLTVTILEPVPEPRSSSVIVMLTVEGSDAVPVGSSSGKRHSNVPSPVTLLKSRLRAT